MTEERRFPLAPALRKSVLMSNLPTTYNVRNFLLHGNFTRAVKMINDARELGIEVEDYFPIWNQIIQETKEYHMLAIDVSGNVYLSDGPPAPLRH